jgi:hypothetical protein
MRLTPEALGDYVAVTLGGRSLRARGECVGADHVTVARRARQVEQARDNPELDAVAAAAEAVRADRLPVRSIAPTIAFHLGHRPAHVAASLGTWRATYSVATVTFATNAQDTALVLVRGARVGTLPRSALLAGLALQLLRPACDGRGAVRRYRLSPTPPPRHAPGASVRQGLEYVRAHGRGFFRPEHLEAARKLAELHALADALPGALEAALAPLPGDARDAVETVVLRGGGFQELEDRNGWPIRSGKLALRIGLEGVNLPAAPRVAPPPAEGEGGASERGEAAA